jgi:alpha-glucosidase (family GH31 glycosyl hydrolase)
MANLIKIRYITFIVIFLLLAMCISSSSFKIYKNFSSDIENKTEFYLKNDEGIITIENQFVKIKINKNFFGLHIISKEKGALTETYDFSEQNSFFYYRNLRKHKLKNYLYFEEVDKGLILHYTTSERNNAKIRVSFTNQKTIKVDFSLEKKIGVNSARLDFKLFEKEAIYGLTERIYPIKRISEVYPKEIGSLDRRGNFYPMVVIGTVGVYTPFYHSSNGYGLYVNTSCYGYFDVGSIIKDRLRFSFNTPKKSDNILEFYIFCGPSHDEILDQYTEITGRPFIPPKWAFNHWRWRDVHEETTEILDGSKINGQVVEDIKKYEELKIPIGNYWIDRPWTPGNHGFAEFSFNPVRFPNAKDMIKSLNDRGYRLMLWGAPFAWGWKKGQNGYESVINGYYTRGDIKHIDFTNPNAFEWWKNKIKVFVSEYNISGWKLDRGDEDQPSFWWNRYFNGLNGAQMRNLYPALYQKCYFEAMTEVWGTDFVNIARAGWSGSQKYVVIWAGDTRGSVERGKRLVSTDLGLRSVILSQLHCSFMGFPIWGSDTGGFIEFRDREVFARWLQFSAFSTIMEIGGRGSHAPWDMPTNPNYDEEMISIYKTYVQLHHDLVDYIYTNAKEAGKTGKPIARPLIFDYPDDPNVKDMWDEYMFGADILVAPIWKSGERQREVYIPDGKFVSYWNENKTYIGPITITVNAPLDQIPFFIRKGSTILGKEW